MKRWILLNLLLMTQVSNAAIVNVETISKIDDLLKIESIMVELSEHRSQVLLHKDQHDQVIKTPKAILIFHGLLNSPHWMAALAQQGFDLGYNVMNIRLEDHFVKEDRYSLDSADYLKWILQSHRMLRVAKELGQEVVVVGHSTGGLMALGLIFNYPDIVRAFC